MMNVPIRVRTTQVKAHKMIVVSNKSTRYDFNTHTTIDLIPRGLLR